MTSRSVWKTVASTALSAPGAGAGSSERAAAARRHAASRGVAHGRNERMCELLCVNRSRPPRRPEGGGGYPGRPSTEGVSETEFGAILAERPRRGKALFL